MLNNISYRFAIPEVLLIVKTLVNRFWAEHVQYHRPDLLNYVSPVHTSYRPNLGYLYS
jgi:hypothetical protein